MTFHDHSNISHSFSIEKIPPFQLPTFEANSYPPQQASRFKWVTIFNLVPSLHYHPHVLPLCLLVVCINTYLYPFAIKRIYAISSKNLLLDHSQKLDCTWLLVKFPVVEIKYGIMCFEQVCCHLEILCKDKAGGT